jgi:hypothetical protein
MAHSGTTGAQLNDVAEFAVPLPDIDLPAGNLPRRRLDEPHDGHRSNALPTTRLTNNAKGLLLFEREGDPIHRVNRGLLHKKFNFYVLHFQNRSTIQFLTPAPSVDFTILVIMTTFFVPSTENFCFFLIEAVSKPFITVVERDSVAADVEPTEAF